MKDILDKAGTNDSNSRATENSAQQCWDVAPPWEGYSPLFSSTVDTAWIKSGALDSVYSTNTSSSFSAVFTTRRNWKKRVQLVIPQTTAFPDV